MLKCIQNQLIEDLQVKTLVNMNMAVVAIANNNLAQAQQLVD